MKKEAGCLTVLVALMLVPVASAFSGWALSLMWGWFVVTTFGAPPLSVWAAVGLSITVNAFIYRQRHPKDDDYEWYTELLGSVLGTLIMLGFGWLVFTFGMGGVR